jgi:hypothetical protein
MASQLLERQSLRNATSGRFVVHSEQFCRRARPPGEYECLVSSSDKEPPLSLELFDLRKSQIVSYLRERVIRDFETRLGPFEISCP